MIYPTKSRRIRLSRNAVLVGRLLREIGGADVVTQDLVESDNWHAWVWGGGCFLVVETGPGEAEVHVYVYPHARGRSAIQAARDVAAAENEAGVVLTGKTPLTNIPARRFASLCGGVVVGIEGDTEVRTWAR